MYFPGTSRFKPIRLLGSGGMGSVHLVFDRQLGCEVGLKTLNLTGGLDLYRFKREFRTLADIKHPNLVKLYELISEGSQWFFTMEYVAGVPFDRYLLASPPDVTFRPEAWAQSSSEPPTHERLFSAVQQLCAGVHAVHEAGYIHRDVKPSNVLITDEGRVVILDFGLVRQLNSKTQSDEGSSGTPAYMAPEQALEKPCRPAADWYAVGTMLYQVLTGHCPFTGAMFEILLKKQTEDPPNPLQVNPEADPVLAELCMRLLQRDPGQRPSGGEVLARLGVRPQKPDTSRSSRLTGGHTPVQGVHGREAELQALQREYARVRKGNLGVVVVVGTSGIGKTTLVNTFLGAARNPGPTADVPMILQGRCHERETVPFKAFDSVVDNLSHRLAKFSGEDLTFVLPDGILYLAEIFPVLRRLKLIEHERYFLPPLRDPTELRNQAFQAFRDLLVRLARMQPVVVFIDDLQWADLDSFALLRALMQQPGAPNLLLIASARASTEENPQVTHNELHELYVQPGVQTISLDPLSDGSIRALVDDFVDREKAAASRKERIAATVTHEAGGHPLFAVELTQHLLNAETPRPNPTLSRESAFRLDDMILARVADLPEQSRKILHVMVVAGDPLTQRVVANAAGVPLGSEEWESSLSALVEDRVLTRRGRQATDVVDVYHDRIRVAVLGALDSSAQQELHKQLALAIEEWERERTDLLARHWLAAGDQDRAKRYACDAAAEARAKLAFDRAAQFYEIAIGLEKDEAVKPGLLRALGDCQASHGHVTRAADAYQRAAAALGEPMQSWDLRHLAAEQLLRGGHVVQGLDLLHGVLKQEGLHLARTPRTALFSLTWRLAWRRLRGFKFKEKPTAELSAANKHRLDVLWSVTHGLGVVDTVRANDFLLRFIALALKLGDTRRVAQGMAVLGAQMAALGGSRFTWAMRLVSEAEVLARCSGHPAVIGLARMCRAFVGYFSGEFDAMASEFMAVEQHFLSKCHGVSWDLATTRSFACFSLRLSGRLRELCERVDRYSADADRTGDRFLAANLRTYMSIVWLVRDNPERAAKDINGILYGWPADMYHVQHFFHLYARCEQALYAENPEAALAAIRAEKSRLASSGQLKVSGIRIENAWISGRVALALAEGKPEKDRLPLLRLVRRHAALLRKSEHQVGVAMGASLEAGAIWLAPGVDRAQALGALDRAVATAETSGFTLLAEAGRWFLGEHASGRRGEEMRMRSHRWLADQGVQNPARLAHMIAPGFRNGLPQ